MKNENHTILIPWDFTPVAEFALLHGFRFAEKANSKKIILVHIIKSDKEHDAALAKLEKVIDNSKRGGNIGLEAIVRKGSIFSTIGEVATEVEAELVVMGTHGLHGMQKLTGSWALKVIVSSKVPFVVVQEAPNENNLQNVVLPIDFRWESKEKLNWVSYLHRYFSPKIHIIKPNTTDVGFIVKIKANIAFARKIMDGKGIDYDIQTAEGKKTFALEIMDYASNINGDLIMILSTKNIGITDYVLGAHEQYIIANSSKIPVMVVNPSNLTKAEGFY